MPIGRPIDQTQVYVLDWQQHLLPKGLTGELTTSGQGLARGYFQQPALTAEKFIPHPYSTLQGERLYRSGDLVKYRPDGTLDFLGRRDHQVKIRGYRIECGEIETNLTRHAEVQDALVLPREDSIGNKILVAYIVSEKGSSPHHSKFRDFLNQRLPSYMIPSHYVFLDSFPLTSNGKIDQRHLPNKEEPSSIEEGTYVAPRNSLETQLTKIWEAILGKQPIGVTDNFFNLGGESLMAVRLCSEIERALQQKIPVTLIFHAQTIEQLAKKIGQSEEPEPSPQMVTIQAGGSHPPIFCVCFGDTFSRYLQHYPDQPLYMFFNQGYDGKPALKTTVKEIAKMYLNDLRTIQSEGPYFLSGYSFGGMVAYEMAQQLRHQGETIGILLLLDPTPALTQRGTSTTDVPLLQTSTPRAIQEGIPGPSRSSRSFAKILHGIRWRLKGFPSTLKFVFNKFTCRMFFSLGYSLPTSFRRFHTTMVVQEAARLYIPETYPGKCILFQTSKNMQARWENMALGGLETYDIPTKHLNMVKEPHTEMVLHRLMNCLAKAQKIHT